MDDSQKKGYIAGFVCSLAAAFFLIIGINTGLNSSGQIILIFGLAFGLLGVGSFWKPESIGQIASEIMENMARNAEKQNRPRHYKKEQKITQIIQNKGNVINVVDSKNTSTTINSSKKSRKKR